MQIRHVDNSRLAIAIDTLKYCVQVCGLYVSICSANHLFLARAVALCQLFLAYRSLNCCCLLQRHIAVAHMCLAVHFTWRLVLQVSLVMENPILVFTISRRTMRRDVVVVWNDLFATICMGAARGQGWCMDDFAGLAAMWSAIERLETWLVTGHRFDVEIHLVCEICNRIPDDALAHDWAVIQFADLCLVRKHYSLLFKVVLSCFKHCLIWRRCLSPHCAARRDAFFAINWMRITCSNHLIIAFRFVTSLNRWLRFLKRLLTLGYLWLFTVRAFRFTGNFFGNFDRRNANFWFNW